MKNEKAKENIKESEKALNPSVVKLGFVSLFADLASEMLYPVTPIFLTTVLGASMTSLGLIEGVAEAVASLLKTYSGIWSDRIQKRKNFILLGYFLSAIAKPFIGFAHSWTYVLGARSLDRTGKGLRSAPRDALISDVVAPEQRGAAFGWHRAMDSFGATIGPLIAVYFISNNTNSLRNLYYWALLPGLVSVLIVLLVQEPHRVKVENIKSNAYSFFKEWGLVTDDFKIYLVAWGIFSIANSSDVFLLMKAKKSGIATQTVILLYCGYNLVYTIASPYLGKLSDKIDRKKILMLGLTIFSIVYVGFAFASNIAHFVVLFLVYGLYMASTDGAGKALAVDLAPQEKKATYLGMLGSVTGLTTICASVTAGALWDLKGDSWAFVYAALGALLSILVLNKLNRKTEIF